jgi:hypothetical protein
MLLPWETQGSRSDNSRGLSWFVAKRRFLFLRILQERRNGCTNTDVWRAPECLMEDSTCVD